MRRLDASKKVATLLLAMGKPLASRLLKYFEPEEIKLVARSAADLGTIPKAMVDELVDEFSRGLAAGADLQGSNGDAEQLLTGVVSDDQLEAIMTDVRGLSGQEVWSRLSQVPSTVITQYLLKEHPQVAALVLFRVAPVCAADVISHLPAALRNELMRRMLSMRPVLEPALHILEATLKDEIIMKAKRNTGPNIHARIADIINKLERPQMDEVLEGLTRHAPKETQVVRRLLFTFEDIAKLSPDARGKLFDQVPPERTILALKGADGPMRELVLGCLSARSRRMIEQELDLGTAVPSKEIAKARRAIADLALEMAERGVLEINASDD